ncbi:MAG: putative ABC transporter permease [Eggerthellaceae bacterium]|nr:putative ABC transporter permease [Eggerthellaceae bacterium]
MEHELAREQTRPKFGPIIRIIEAYFVLVMLAVLGYAVVSKPADFTYDISMLRVLVVMATAARSIWLIEKRADTTRRFVVVSMIVVIVLSVLDVVFGGEFEKIAAVLSMPVVVAGGVLYFAGSLFIVFYFAFSEHAKRIFVVPASAGRVDQPTSDPNEDIYEKRFSWPWWRNLGIYYCTFSIFGHWAEIGFCWLIVLGVVMGDYDFTHAQLWDWWLCPYPAEGIAMVLIVVILAPFKDWLLKKFGGRVVPALIVSFLVNMLVCASIDFSTGITANADYSLWDYRDLPFNFMGQIVLQNTLVYSVAATFIVWVLYPLMAKALHRMPPRVANTLFVGLVAFYLFLELLYYVNIGPSGIILG